MPLTDKQYKAGADALQAGVIEDIRTEAPSFIEKTAEAQVPAHRALIEKLARRVIDAALAAGG